MSEHQAMIGQRLLHYEIQSSLGAGGMGEVYLARDTKLDRDVAIKVVPEGFALDEERLARFEREAKVLASLNHPGIATLYGLEEVDGRHFLVMELVEGETLAERLARGRIPIDDALALFVQLAEGLEAAHARGIVHRDLKPANVKVTPEGKLKVLDFGLAKTFPTAAAEGDISQSPTLTKDTALGTVLGTAAYMSPEQARGASVDERADIWAFGACLYEALTGRGAFRGVTIADVIASVVHEEPDWTGLPSETPPGVRALLERCLRKDVRRRLQSIGDARIELEDASASPGRDVDTARPGQRASAFAVGLTLGLVAAAFAALWPRGTAPTADPVVPIQLTSNPVENSVTSAAISPDGRYLAFVDAAGLHVRLIETGETHRLETPEAFTIGEVDWYPDGTSLLFTATVSGQAAAWRIAILGGEPRKLADGVWRASISPDGERIAFLPNRIPAQSIHLMGPSGESPQSVVAGVEGSFFSELAWSPGGRWLLYGNSHADRENSIEAVRADGSGHHVVVADNRLVQRWRGVLPFCWTPDHRLVYSRREESPSAASSNLWSVQIDPATAVPWGEPRRLTHLSGFNVAGIAVTDDAQRLSVSLERDQSDVYVSRLVEGGTSLADEKRLTLDDSNDYPSGWFSGSLSILFDSDRAGTRDLYRQHLEEAVPVGLHTGPSNEFGARRSEDGSWILYRSGRELMRMPTSGGAPERILTVGLDGRVRCAPQRRCILGERDASGAAYVFSVLDPLEGRIRELTRGAGKHRFVQWDLAPDGLRVAIAYNDGAIRLLELESGSETAVTDRNWSFGEFVAWDAEGKGVYNDAFVRGSTGFLEKALVYVRLGETVDVHVLRHRREQWHVRPVPSPDGNYLAYAVMTFSGNAWMLEDF